MAKVFGSARKNEKSNDKQPDFRGNFKLGGFTGPKAEEKNRECAQWLRNVTTEFTKNKETYISVAMWKNIDRETDEPYISIALEDNSWRSKDKDKDKDSAAAPAKSTETSDGGSKVEEEEGAFDF
jgi:uncharacterized protein (DUF736 family)